MTNTHTSSTQTLGKAFDVSNWSGVFSAYLEDRPPYRPLSAGRPLATAINGIPMTAGEVGVSLASPVSGPAAAQAIKDMGYSKAIIGSQNETISRAQAQSCLNVGFEVDAYVYLLFYQDPVAQVNEALRRFAGMPLGMLWLDCEDSYAENLTEQQTVDFIGRAAQACEGKIFSGIYTAGWWWTRQTGNSTAFSGFKLWHASADRVGDLGDVNYGGWKQIYMEQYQFDTLLAGVNTDLNVYRLDTPAPPPHVAPNVELYSPSLEYVGFNTETGRDEYKITQTIGVA